MPVIDIINHDDFIDFLEKDVYASDLHVHHLIFFQLRSHLKENDTISNRLFVEEFFKSPGDERNGDMQLTHPELMPTTTTYKSYMDGRVRIILAGLHSIEYPMMHYLSRRLRIISQLGIALENKVTTVKAILAIANIDVHSINSYAKTLGLTTKERWKPIKEEIELNKHLATKYPNKYVLIDSESAFNSNIHAPFGNQSSVDQFPTSQLDKMRVFFQIEGGHIFNFNYKRLPDSFEKKDHQHTMYGGFQRYDVALLDIEEENISQKDIKIYFSKDHPELLDEYPEYYNEYFGSSTPNLTEEELKEKLLNEEGNSRDSLYDEKGKLNAKTQVDIALLDKVQYLRNNGLKVFIPSHYYWNGLGGFAWASPRLKKEKKAKRGAILLRDAVKDLKSAKLGFSIKENSHLTELGRQVVKYFLKHRIIIDIKHNHPYARKQILNMIKNGYDYPPVYNEFGNPLCSDNTNPYSDLETDSTVQQFHIPTGRTDCRSQVMVSHAALCFCSRTVNLDKQLFPYTSDEKIVREVQTRQLVRKGSDDDYELWSDRPESPTSDYENLDNMNLFDEEIKEIIELNGFIGFISEDRVLRTHYEGVDLNFSKPEDRFLWPDPNSTKTEHNDIDFFYLTDAYNPPPTISTDEANYGADVVNKIKDRLYNTNSDLKDDYHSKYEFYYDPNADTTDTNWNWDLHNFEKSIDQYTMYTELMDFRKKTKNDKKFNKGLAGLNALYASIHHVRLIMEREQNAHQVGMGQRVDDDYLSDLLQDNITLTEWRDQIIEYYKYVGIASDMEGGIDPLDLYASPRMYPIMTFYIGNRINWQIKEDMDKIKNKTVGAINGATWLSTQLGTTSEADYRKTLVDDIMKRILGDNFLDRVKDVGWE